jgi:pimeloyl-ACP methyl ester carboxylesterase
VSDDSQSSGISLKIAAGVALGLGAAAGGAAALLHRSVRRATANEEEIAVEGLTLPADLRREVVEMDDGALIHVAERGEGRAIVLIHGFMLDGSIWAQQFRDLSGSYRMVAIDQRGHGSSELPAWGYGARRGRLRGAASDASSPRVTGPPLAEAARTAAAGVGAPAVSRLARDLARVLEAMDLRETLLVGHSMGGMVVLQLAQDHPGLVAERVSSMALVSTLAGPFKHIPGWTRTARLMVPASARALLLADRVGVRALPPSDLRFWMTRLGFGADAPPAQVRFVESLHLSVSPRTLAGLLPSLAVFDLSASLGSIDTPALLVVGTRDRLTPPRQARRLADSLPHAQLVELARCGHMPMIERPHEFSHLLEEFADKTAHK